MKLRVKLDESIWREIVTNNEYELPDAFDSNDVVIDIGAHIGIFSQAVLKRGVRRVYAFEPHAKNAAALRQNMAEYGDRIVIQEAAVWRSDRSGDTLLLDHSMEKTSPCILLTKGNPLVLVALDDVLEQIDKSEPGRNRIIIKTDCEGSEFPIFYTSKKLHLVSEIRGESHDMLPSQIPAVARVGDRHFTGAELKVFLQEQGFHVTLRPGRGHKRLGYFTAVR